jgi:DNA polymerase-3 subunit epsilon
MNTNKIEAIKAARKIIAERPAYLDAETTGLGGSAEIVDIAIINYDGTELMNTLVRPMSPIPEEATNIHGIRNEDVTDAPTFADILPNLESYSDRMIVIYNQDYDLRILAQSAKANNADSWMPQDSICAMKLYAQFYGDWNGHHQSYRWQKQSSAAKQLGIEIPANLHRAAADANMCRLIIEAMAATPLPGEAKRSSQLFVETFNSMADYIHNWAKDKGFWQAGKDRNDGEMIALMHSELSEALEAVRHGNPPDDKIPEFNGYEAELADCIIRIMDTAIARKLRVAEAIVAKMAFNEGRPYKHGKEF